MATWCPHCGKDFVGRVRPEGVIEGLFSLCNVYAFRCQLCSHRFKAFERGHHVTDRRQYKRIKVRLPVTFSWEHMCGDGHVVDIAIGGCRLMTDVKLLEDNFLQLHIHVPGYGPGIRVGAAVVRSVQPPFVGLQFLRLFGDEKTRLSRFMLDLLTAHRDSHGAKGAVSQHRKPTRWDSSSILPIPRQG